jgi:uncharacterized MAPEG superfamily protein
LAVTVAYTCVFLGFLLVYLVHIVVIVARARLPGAFDHRNPRAHAARLEGWGARAHAAHQNAIEAFAPFAAAVIIAGLVGVDEHRVATLAVTVVIARAVHPLVYMANLDYLRTAVWGVGFVATVGLYVLALLAL